MKTPLMILGLALCLTRAGFAQGTPLCIIDGLVVTAAQCGLPGLVAAGKKIESVEVLKGPAAAAQYGVDAMNGVVVVTTVAASPPKDDPLARYLFSTELVMSHQQAISLTDRQRSAIQDAMHEAQRAFVDLQFRMSAEVEKLQQLLQGTTADEDKVLKQVDRVLDVEREVKHKQLGLLVRVKNQLTEQQQAALEKLSGEKSGLRIRPD